MPPRRTGRTLALLVVMALGLGMSLAACGGDDDGPPESRSKSPGPSPTNTDGDRPAADPGFGVPKVGQCFRMTAEQARASVAAPARVNCRQPHTTLVAYVGYVAEAITPLTPVATRRTLAKKVCEPAYRALVGGTVIDRAQSLLTWTLFTPGQRQLERGARWVRCDVLARSGDTLVPLPSTEPLLRGGVPPALRVCQNQDGVDVSCAGPHAFRVAGVFQAPGTTYPGITTLEARKRCQEKTKTFAGFFQPPSREGWDAGDRFVRCLLARATATSPTP